MADERKNSPHYIPELDPNSKKGKSAILEKMFLWLEYLRLIALVASLAIAVIAYFKGWEDVFIAAVIVAFAAVISLLALVLN